MENETEVCLTKVVVCTNLFFKGKIVRCTKLCVLLTILFNEFLGMHAKNREICAAMFAFYLKAHNKLFRQNILLFDI